MRYLNTLPAWLQRWYAPGSIWQMPDTEQAIYLTFDDGPHPEATPFVLECLKTYKAKASFFCVGSNAAMYPVLAAQIRQAGHLLANHTQHHKNGWKTKSDAYIQDLLLADEFIQSPYFRPPYGRITRAQQHWLHTHPHSSGLTWKVIMWSVLSGDFDSKLSGQTCADMVIARSRPGSIIVFHDSEKAFPRLKVALPLVLAHFAAEGYRFSSLHY